MTRYYYKATTLQGEISEGELEASDESVVIQHLQKNGQIPIRVRPARWIGQRAAKALPAASLALFTRELATLLKAGLPLDRALRLLIELTQEPLHSLTQRLLDAVRQGTSLSDALAAQGIFSRFYINMVRAGEIGGTLETTLMRLADHLEKTRALRETVISALIYPGILLTVAALSVMILLTFVVPHFAKLFADAGRALPLATHIVVSTADLLRYYGWLILLLIGSLWFYLQQQLKQPRFKRQWDNGLLHLPLIGDLLKKLDIVRFAQTLGTLLSNGVPLLTALGLVKDTLSNTVLIELFEEAQHGLKAGHGLADQLTTSTVFPKLALQMIKVGEETGRLEEMLFQIAEVYDREVKTAVQRLLAFLEPVLIVGLGIIISGIIMSLLIAIISVNELAF